MIKLEKTEVVGWEAAIRGMRNPMNSWDKSDSIHIPFNMCDDEKELRLAKMCHYIAPIIKENDHDLMMKLRNAGTDHRKFMRMIVVYVDITAPLYWWKEFKTYRAGRRFGDDEPDIIDAGYLEYDIETNSCSTMHKIHEKEFTLEDFSREHLISEPYDIDNEDPIDGEFEDTGLVLVANSENGWLGHCYHTASGDRCVEYLAPKTLLDRYIISALNACREAYLKTKDKKYWWQMIQLLPSSYNQKRTVMLNYEVLANIYKSRKNHKLDEWVEFCKWIEGLPYSELITGTSLKDIPICNEIMEEAKSRVTNEED